MSRPGTGVYRAHWSLGLLECGEHSEQAISFKTGLEPGPTTGANLELGLQVPAWHFVNDAEAEQNKLSCDSPLHPENINVLFCGTLVSVVHRGGQLERIQNKLHSVNCG